MTEPAGPEELIDKAAQALTDARTTTFPGAAKPTELERHQARALAAAGLLADPEQGSELEKARNQVRALTDAVHGDQSTEPEVSDR